MYDILNEKINKTAQSISQLFENYLVECQYNKQLSEQTIKGYREVFNTFLMIMPEIKTVLDLKPYLLNEFFRRISTRERIVGRDTIKVGVKPSTIKTYYNKLMAFFRWLENNSYIENFSLSKNLIKPPNPKYQDEKALTQTSVSKIIASISLYGVQDEFMYKRDMLMVSILLYTGVRKGELLALRNQDVNFSNRTLFINGQTSKSKKSRSIPLHSLLILQFKAYLKLKKERRFQCEYLIVSSKTDSRLTEHGIKHWVEKYKKHSGVNFHLHQFRHTFACTLAKENADIVSIMAVLGHSSTRMTERYLRSMKPESARGFIDKISF